jgi:phage repressor protein C with HTH and peptisase S24 domain
METIVSRLKHYLDFKNISVSVAETEIGISNASLSKPFKNGTTIKTDTLEKFLITYNEISPEWLLTGRGDMLKTDKNAIIEPVESNRKTKDAVYELQRVPLFNLEATMGLIPLVDGNGIDEDKIIDYLSIPSMSSCDGAIYASGDSMYPLLKSGDMIAYKRIAVERASIFFGEMYIVAVKLDESSTMKTIKFVHQSELGDDYVKLVSHNQHHSPKDVKLSQIAAIGLVRASIRLHN